MPSEQPVWYDVLIVEDSSYSQPATDEAPVLVDDFFHEPTGAVKDDAALIVDNRTIDN
jgi:hypothetical protein